MDKKLLSVLGALAAILAIFFVAIVVIGNLMGQANFQTDNATLPLGVQAVLDGDAASLVITEPALLRK